MAACGGRDESGGADSKAATSDGGAPPAPAATSVSGACPATGRWSPCAVVERLERMGLVPRVDSSAAEESPLTPRGVFVRLGRGELELYFYGDTAASAREVRLLDRKKYLDYAAPQSMRGEPTLIHSVNLIAILHSTNSHQRERVADALNAGPPQPPSP